MDQLKPLIRRLVARTAEDQFRNGIGITVQQAHQKKDKELLKIERCKNREHVKEELRLIRCNYRLK